MIPEDEPTEIITAEGTSKTSRIRFGVMPYKEMGYWDADYVPAAPTAA